MYDRKFHLGIDRGRIELKVIETLKKTRPRHVWASLFVSLVVDIWSDIEFHKIIYIFLYLGTLGSFFIRNGNLRCDIIYLVPVLTSVYASDYIIDE